MRSDLPVKGNADSKHTWIARVTSPPPWFMRLISPGFPNAPTLPHRAPGSTPARARTIRHTEPRGRAASRFGGAPRSYTGASEPHCRTPAADMVASAHAGQPRSSRLVAWGAIIAAAFRTDVARFAASAGGVLWVRITSTLSRTNSAVIRLAYARRRTSRERTRGGAGDRET